MQRGPVNVPARRMEVIRQTRSIRPGVSGMAEARRIDRGEALSGPRAVRQLIHSAEASGLSLQPIYGGLAGGRLLAAAVMAPQAGGTGLVFTSIVHGEAEVNALAAAVDLCCRQASGGPVKLAQALLDRGEEPQAAALEAVGFSPLANLAYMQARVPAGSPAPPVPPGIELRTWSPALADAFVSALEASYVATRDCPGLQGLRATRDVLQGHRGTGRFNPKLWTLVRIDGREAGVMLLNAIPSAGCVELVYLGLAREHRGRGVGTMLMRRALAQCAQLGESLMTLAVDIDNAPAVALYRRFGFQRTASRVVFVRPLT